MARRGEERRSRSQELLSPDLPETRERWNATQLAAHERLFPFSDNLTTLMFIVASDLGENPERTTYEFSFYSRDGLYDLHIQKCKGSISGIVLFNGKPNCVEILQFVQNLHN